MAWKEKSDFATTMPTLVWRRQPASGINAVGEGSAAARRDAVPDPVISDGGGAAADAGRGGGAAPAARPAPVVPAAAASASAAFAAADAAPAAGPLAHGVPVPPRSVVPVPSTFTAHTMGPYYRQQQQQQHRPLLRRYDTAEDGTTITLPNHVGRRTERTGKTNRAGHATAAAKKRSQRGATSERNLPPGAYQQPSGKIKSAIWWGGTQHYIGTFDTPDRASAAYRFVRKELALAKLPGLGPDEVHADAAKEKAMGAEGGVGPKETKPKVTSRRGRPLGFTQNATGKFVSQMYWGGKNRYIGTFDTADQASTVSWLVRRDLDSANLSAAGADEVDAAFDAAKLYAVRAVGGSNSRRKTA